eukprot:TRINITY_DN7657_c0_g1_i1.p1 TRINITY_DN7657_c0_g1~~TRINITY_DN7657_c0_g1_i1.p1  ORF type:complete len:857 (+),score=195.62 TRINITY_DN7657_c0_g1_i1:219-2789(+)
MSLFRARDWWETKAGIDEEFDSGLLCVANVDNAADLQSKICVGSFQGLLRIYAPRQMDYRAEDLLLETDLGSPILQIECGMFLPDSQAIGLAVLHPRKLVVYAAVRVGSNAEATYLQLQKQYEHTLDRNAHSMTFGPFGGVYGKDYICVQSMDGQLSFFEQMSSAFSRYLPNFLLPGPICYVSKIDSLLTFSSRMSVDCYKYQVLAAAKSDTKPAAAGADSDQPALLPQQSGKRVHSDWSLSVGEQIWEMRVARVSRSLSSAQVDIVLMGEYHLFCVTETGTIRQQKRLHFVPSALLTYSIGADAEFGVRHNLLVGSHASSLMVFRDLQLMWSAKIGAPPIAVRIGKFGGVNGMIVTLDDTGRVRISYLGTDAATSGVAAADARDLDYEAMNREHRELSRTIRDAMTGQLEPQETVTVRSQVPLPELEQVEDDGSVRSVVNARVFLSYGGSGSVEQVSVACKAPLPFGCSNDSGVIETLRGSRTPANVPIGFRLVSNSTPATLTMPIVVSYQSGESSQPRSVLHQMQLSLTFVSRIVSPIKTATYKITIDTNKSAVPLNTLFDDVLLATVNAGPDIRAVAANALSFRYHNGEDCTILASKNAGRYRLQSDKFEALWLITSELTRRLTVHFAADPEALVLSFAEALPLLDFFNIIDAHFAARQALTKSLADLEQRAQQFRVVQKRLLVRFKDKTPNPLNNLPILLEGTYQQIMEISHVVETQQAQLADLSCRLSCAVRLVNLLIKYRFAMNDQDATVLTQHMCEHVDDTLTQGWEERVDAALMQLLRTSLAKSARDQATMPAPLAPSTDTGKLKKHIQLVCERLSKGMRLTKAKKEKSSRRHAQAAAVSEAAAEADQ